MYGEALHQDSNGDGTNNNNGGDGFVVLGDMSDSIAPVVTGGLSLIASYIMLRETIVDHQDGKANSITRLVMGLSMANFLFSLGTVMGTFASPAELSYLHMNFGTTATCDTQGFLLTLGFTASPMFFLALSYFYLLTIRYDYPEQALQRVEILVHILLWTAALAMAIVPLVLGMYNNDLESCWITEHPLGCAHEDSTVDCQRGHGASDYAHVVAFVPLWPCMVMCTFAMVCLFWTVRSRGEPTSTSYSVGDQSDRRQKTVFPDVEDDLHDGLYNSFDQQLSHSVAIQGAAYIAAFILTFSAHMATTVLDWISGEWHEALEFLAFVITMPLQGFFTCCVFMYQRKMQTTEGRIFRLLFCCRGTIRRKQRGKALGKDELDESRRGGISRCSPGSSRFFQMDEDGTESLSEWSY